MEAFQHRELDVLVSTVVIEVGIDVSNATVMVIENCERFGACAAASAARACRQGQCAVLLYSGFRQ